MPIGTTFPAGHGPIAVAQQLQRGVDLGEKRLDLDALVRALIGFELRLQLLLFGQKLRNSRHLINAKELDAERAAR